ASWSRPRAAARPRACCTSRASRPWGTRRPPRGRSPGRRGRCSRSPCPSGSLQQWQSYLSLIPGVGVGQRVHATDDLADFLGNAGLARLVCAAGVLLVPLVGVVPRGLHGLLTGAKLGGGRLQQGEEDPALDVPGQQRVEDLG